MTNINIFVQERGQDQGYGYLDDNWSDQVYNQYQQRPQPQQPTAPHPSLPPGTKLLAIPTKRFAQFARRTFFLGIACGALIGYAARWLTHS